MEWLLPSSGSSGSDPPASPDGRQEITSLFTHKYSEGSRPDDRRYRESQHTIAFRSARGFKVSGPTGKEPTRSVLGPAHLAEISSKVILRGMDKSPVGMGMCSFYVT